MSLIHSNPYLRDPVMRKYLVTRSVKSSTQVEGIKSTLEYDMTNRERIEANIRYVLLRYQHKQLSTDECVNRIARSHTEQWLLASQGKLDDSTI